MEKRSFILEKGMGRTFAREWYNTNRALLIAEHERRMDAKRTPLDRYMERMFYCADPSVVDRKNSRTKDRQMTLEELFYELPSCAFPNLVLLQQKEPAVAAAAVEQRDCAPQMETTTTIPAMKKKKTKDSTAVGPEQSVQAIAKSPCANSPELTELELAVGFCHDLGAFGTCKYATTVV